MNRHNTILRRDDATFLIVDFQEKIANVMDRRDAVAQEIVRLIQGLRILDVPILITEQYRKGLGATSPLLTELLAGIEIIEKMTFSCVGQTKFWEKLRATKRRQIIVAGIETHICVLQTVLDLLANGYQVHVPISATCSRSDANRDNALHRMEHAGAILTNTESILFELLVEAGTEEFKHVRKLIL